MPLPPLERLSGPGDPRIWIKGAGILYGIKPRTAIAVRRFGRARRLAGLIAPGETTLVARWTPGTLRVEVRGGEAAGASIETDRRIEACALPPPAAALAARAIAALPGLRDASVRLIRPLAREGWAVAEIL